MVDFLANDNSLVGFWPLNEPSGSPTFHNWAPSRAKKPAGISYNLHIHTTETANVDEPRAVWPGTITEFGQESGVNYFGYKVQGNYDLGITQVEKVLVLGHGGTTSRNILEPPRIVQSGFTVGFWVNPRSDGRGKELVSSIESTNRRQAKAHSLLTKAEDDDGWIFGVSGLLSEAAQFAPSDDPKVLTAFVHNLGGITVPGGAGEVHINTPIESGRYTHLTMTYRLSDDTSNNNTEEFTLYKDGRVAASGQNTGVLNAETLTSDNTSYLAKTFSVGGTSDEADILDRFDFATGWGHLVSGVYIFDRVLHEGEILDLHLAGGLHQQDGGIAPVEGKEITLQDSKIIAYYPFISQGFGDVTKNRNALISDIDEGDESNWIIVPGPFNRGGLSNAGSNITIALGGLSGLSNLLTQEKSFTIAGWFSADIDASDFDGNMLMSMGATDSTPTPSPSEAVLGFYLTTDATGGVKWRTRFFPLGDSTDGLINLESQDIDPWSETECHFAVLYDDQTRGIAFYLDGALQESGTLSHSFSDQIVRLVGSGFPFLFLNGVDDVDTDAFLNNGGTDSFAHELLIMGRPLDVSEINFLAQSGIDITSLYYSVHDPRLLGYWKGTESDNNPLMVADRARQWNELPANLVRSTSDRVWDDIQATQDGPWYQRDEFGQSRETPPELESFGALGISSGVWSINAGSLGTASRTQAADRKSSIASFSSRFKPVIEQRTLTPQSIYDYALSFEILPSGDIPKHDIASVTSDQFNSMIHSYGDGTDQFYSYLTSIYADNPDPLGQDAGTGTSGVSIVFAGEDGNNFEPLASGNLSFGVPSRVLFHMTWENPYYMPDASSAILNINLYINGLKHYSRRVTSLNARIWSNVAAQDDWIWQFGGIAVDENTVAKNATVAGLGHIYLRNIFMLRGIFSQNDIDFFAVSGLVDSPGIPGYTNQQSSTQVTILETDLQGYYRFNGGTSGELDLSTKGNNLIHLARDIAEQNLFADEDDNAAHNLKYLPGPLTNSDLLIQTSGITYANDAFVDANAVTPFALSGTPFNVPDQGFSVGFLFAKRETVSSVVDAIISFGIVPNSDTETDTDLNRSWAIVWDDSENIKMVFSKDGRMFLDDTSNAAKAGSVECGAFRGNVLGLENYLEIFKRGLIQSSHLDSWAHVGWTYDSVSEELRCYFNGNLVDIKEVDGGLNVPADDSAKIISFLVPQTGVWQWGGFNTDLDSIITDVFYSSSPFTADQMKYIAQNGIDDVTGTEVSGIIGGFIHGLDIASGIIGGYLQGLDTVSGIIGGNITGALEVSGIVGGYISGIGFVTGDVGGFIHGSVITSGLIGGFISGSSLASGNIGAFILGGLEGQIEFDGGFTISAFAAKNFDSLVEIRQHNTADFDAKVVIFQRECPPLVEIQVPNHTVSGLVPPFDQYFIGKASGLQGKTIEKTRWTFGDFSAPVEVSESGNGCYPVSHRYSTSGVFIAKFEAIDSDGIHDSDIRILNIASGIPTVEITLSGIPQHGNAALVVDFMTTIENLPPGVNINAKLLDFDDGQSTVSFNPTHEYTQPGRYNPIWCVRDSRGFFWCDSLCPGSEGSSTDEAKGGGPGGGPGPMFGTDVSGDIGGFIRGQSMASGIIGSFVSGILPPLGGIPDLVLWLEATSGVESSAGTPANSGDSVQFWLDASSETNDATQNTASERPIFDEDNPSLRFDGSDDNMTISSISLTSASVFVVAKKDSNSDQIVALGDLTLLGNSTIGQDDAGNNVFASATITHQHSTSFELLSYIWDGSDVDFYSNGNLIGSDSFGGLISPNNIGSDTQLLGPDIFFNGDVQAIIVYDRDLNSSERNTVESYLISKYNL